MIYMLEDDDNIRNFVLYALTSAGMEAEGFAYPDDFWNAVNLKTAPLTLLARWSQPLQKEKLPP